MSHAAFMPDAELFPRASAGDGEAALALIERHGLRLHAVAAGLTGSADAATPATLETFARLLTGALPTATGFAALAEALPGVVPSLGPVAIPVGRRRRRDGAAMTTELLTRGLLARLPEAERAALAGALWARATAPTAPDHDERRPGEPTRPLPAIDALGPLVGAETMSAEVLAASDEAALPRRARRRGLDRYVERRPPARWLVPLAIMATLLAFWMGRGTMPTAPVAPAPLPSTWPTLRPRTTPIVAQIEPTAIVTLPSPQAIIIVTPTTPPTATVEATAPIVATPTAPPPPVANEPPVAAAPAPPTLAPAPTPMPSVVAVVPPPVSRAPLPTTAPPPVPTVAPPRPTAIPPTATALPPPTAVPSPSAAATALPTIAATPTASPSPPPTTPQLALTTQSLGFGVEVGPRALLFTNPGADPLTWRVVADSTWLELAQSSGTLPPGTAQAVPITVAREDLPTGAYNGAVQVLTNGGDGLVPVTMTVSPSNTTVSAFAEPPTPIGALGCAEPTTHLVSATIAGDQPPRKAVVYFALNGGTQQTKDLTAQGQRYSATLGPFNEPGSVAYSLVITEADGNVVRSAPYTLAVNDCASRVRTVPVTPPTTQPFALGGGGHHRYTFAVTKPGSLVVTIAWRGDATRLSTLLYSPRLPEQPYEQRTGVGSLTFSFPVTEADIAAGGNWALHLINYEGGEATGRLELRFVPEGQPTPAPEPSVAPRPSPTPQPTPTTPPSPTATSKPQPSPTPSAAPIPSVKPALVPGTPAKEATPGR